MNVRRRMALVNALQRRLDALHEERGRLRRASIIDPSDTDIDDAWALTSARIERTRKTLIRTRAGMPYWKWACQRDAEIHADGLVFTPAAAIARR